MNKNKEILEVIAIFAVRFCNLQIKCAWYHYKNKKL